MRILQFITDTLQVKGAIHCLSASGWPSCGVGGVRRGRREGSHFRKVTSSRRPGTLFEFRGELFRLFEDLIAHRLMTGLKTACETECARRRQIRKKRDPSDEESPTRTNPTRTAPRPSSTASPAAPGRNSTPFATDYWKSLLW